MRAGVGLRLRLNPTYDRDGYDRDILGRGPTDTSVSIRGRRSRHPCSSVFPRDRAARRGVGSSLRLIRPTGFPCGPGSPLSRGRQEKRVPGTAWEAEAGGCTPSPDLSPGGRGIGAAQAGQVSDYAAGPLIRPTKVAGWDRHSWSFGAGGAGIRVHSCSPRIAPRGGVSDHRCARSDRRASLVALGPRFRGEGRKKGFLARLGRPKLVDAPPLLTSPRGERDWCGGPGGWGQARRSRTAVTVASGVMPKCL